jgi:ADP-heptose:LPS heptosyltransferase
MNEIKKILVISSNRLGDSILSSGLHRFFKEKYQNTEITLVCGQIPSGLFEYCSYIDKLIVLKKRKYAVHWIILWSKLFLKKWFRIVDLRGSLISFLLISQKSFRFKTNRISGNHKVIDITKNIAGEVLAPTISLSDNLNFKNHSLNQIKYLKKRHDFVMIAPTANWIGKIWPAKRFLDLIISLKKETKFKKTIFILVGPENEKSLITEILAAKKKYVLDLFGKASLLELFCIMKLCKLFIGNDSGLMHMASLTGINTVGLFGPSDKIKYRPWGEKNFVISSSKSPNELMGHKSFSAKGSGSLMLELETNKVLENLKNYLSKLK